MAKTTKKTTTSNNSTIVANPAAAPAKDAAAILAAAAAATQGLIKSSLGTKKSTLFREGVLPEDAKGKKSMRKKLRNVLFSIASSMVAEEDKAKQTKLIAAFNEFYLSTYQENNYSLSSICNENLSKERKDILIKALEIAKG
ncbi:MAG: hypothetical protein NC131_06145 [Roseburia sp.]|nr:hypothetical protein [Roseburia sp.]